MALNKLSIPLFCMASLVAGCPSNSSEEGDATYDKLLQEGVDRIQAGGIVAVHAEMLEGDRRIRARSGVAQLNSETPVDFDSYFRMGSNTKTFVAVVLLQLAGEGALSLDDTVEQWLPGVVSGNGNDGSLITIRQLLQHTSGIYNYIGPAEPDGLDPQPALAVLRSAEEYMQHRLDHMEAEELVALAMAQKPGFDPGTQWSYSNTNYVLAGMIIERATGNQWSEEVEARILDPLGLDHTFEPGDEPDLPAPHAVAYQQYEVEGPLIDVTSANHTMAGASGSLVTTTADLAKFWRALTEGSLLEPEQMAELHATVPAPALNLIAPGTEYGLGIMWIPTSCGGGYWSHSGSTLGYSTRNAASDDGSRVIVMSLSTSTEDEEAAYTTFIDTFKIIDQLMCAD
ncbi:serine hydrolase domain-containing protein [Sorangium sp. So ce291]|uniref:serine hydrolase domain-containing protein n=1 Tax=Sorangium sp. So ce291 TaxID=3133294 RepID=UPI003F606DEA